MAWCCQAASHYLSQCWPRSILIYGVTRPQWVKFDSDNVLEPVHCQIIFWNKTGLLSIRLSGIKLNEVWIGILNFSLKKIPLKILSLKWRHFDQASICKIIIPPLQRSWKGGILVSPCPSLRLSVCGPNRVHSVSSTILVGSISYLHILSSNFRRCVTCNVCLKIWNFGKFFKSVTLSSFDLGSNMTQ